MSSSRGCDVRPGHTPGSTPCTASVQPPVRCCSRSRRRWVCRGGGRSHWSPLCCPACACRPRFGPEHQCSPCGPENPARRSGRIGFSQTPAVSHLVWPPEQHRDTGSRSSLGPCRAGAGGHADRSVSGAQGLPGRDGCGWCDAVALAWTRAHRWQCVTGVFSRTDVSTTNSLTTRETASALHGQTEPSVCKVQRRLPDQQPYRRSSDCSSARSGLR